MMESMALAAQSLHKISLPTLLVHGAQDPIVSYSSSEFIYSTICSDDKTLLVRLIYCCVLVKLFNEVKVNSTVAWA